MKLIIAGGRDFTNYELLEGVCKMFIVKQTSLKEGKAKTSEVDDITIISGKAIGADLLGERFASKYNLPLMEFPADWEKYGKAAGPIRNEEMAKNATHAICFWDGKSKGTANMIENCKKYNLVHKIIRYE